jgi:hypothetical protein
MLLTGAEDAITLFTVALLHELMAINPMAAKAHHKAAAVHSRVRLTVHPHGPGLFAAGAGPTSQVAKPPAKSRRHESVRGTAEDECEQDQQ